MPRPKRPETEAPDRLSPEDEKRMVAWRNGHGDRKIRNMPNDGPGSLDDHCEDCLLWHREKDRWRRDWVLVCQRWIKKHFRDEARWKAEKQAEKPQYDLGKRQRTDHRRPIDNVTDIRSIVKQIEEEG